MRTKKKNPPKKPKTEQMQEYEISFSFLLYISPNSEKKKNTTSNIWLLRTNQNALEYTVYSHHIQSEISSVGTGTTRENPTKHVSQNRHIYKPSNHKGQISCLKLMAGGCKWPCSFFLSQQRHGNQLGSVEMTRKMNHGLNRN